MRFGQTVRKRVRQLMVLVPSPQVRLSSVHETMREVRTDTSTPKGGWQCFFTSLSTAASDESATRSRVEQSRAEVLLTGQSDDVAARMRSNDPFELDCARDWSVPIPAAAQSTDHLRRHGSHAQIANRGCGRFVGSVLVPNAFAKGKKKRTGMGSQSSCSPCLCGRVWHSRSCRRGADGPRVEWNRFIVPGD